MYRHAAERATVPVVLHLDHCTERNVLLDCLKAGWGSVLSTVRVARSRRRPSKPSR